MSDAQTAMESLDKRVAELDAMSKIAARIEQDFEPVEREYQDFIDAFEVGCWDRHVKDGEKLPSAELREKLARRELPTALLGKYGELSSKRRRIEKRIAGVKAAISAQQSILSAYRAEVEGSGGRLRGVA